MKFVNLKQLAEGDRLAENITDSEGRLLLRKGTVLNARLIEGLMRQRIRGVYIVDVQISANENHSNRAGGMNPNVRQAAHTPMDVRSQAVNVLGKVFQQINETGDFDDRPVLAAAKRMTHHVRNNRNPSFNLVESYPEADRLYQHCVNVCFLAAITANRLGFSDEQIYHLMIGALLHDIGYALVGAAEHKEEHVIRGYEILRKHVNIPVQSKTIVLQHHEKINGTGYPYGKSRKELNPSSQLCAMANEFDAYLNRRNEFRLPHEGVEYIMAHADRSYDISVVRAFVSTMEPYPIGTYVRLTNGLEGTVCNCPSGTPFRPSILISDSNKTFHLTEHTTVFVDRILPPKTS